LSNDYVPAAAVMTPFDSATLDNFEFIMRELVYRPFQLIEAAIPAMKANRTGQFGIQLNAIGPNWVREPDLFPAGPLGEGRRPARADRVPRVG
jgi:NAD(P)-dependent dehydrogenase (short-subunit alcohol dehydrogenase family)